VTHVLLPDDSLCRRRDAVGDIGEALAAKAAGSGHRRIAKRLGRERATVRGWLRRFEALAEAIRERFTRWAVALDPMLGPIDPAGSAFADAVAAIGVAAAAAVRRLGPLDPWRFASAVTGGRLLSNTTRPSLSSG
jgi:Homeodomain-like domain